MLKRKAPQLIMFSSILNKEASKIAQGQGQAPETHATNVPNTVVATDKTGDRIASKEWISFIAVMTVTAAWHLWTLMSNPVFTDEGWFGNRAWAWVQTGRAFGSVDWSNFGQFAEGWRYFGVLQAVINGLGLQLLGLRLESMRLVSLAAGLLLLVVLWLLARQVGGARVGLLAVALLALTDPFATSAHLGRPDILIALFGTTALLLLNGTKAGDRKSVIRAMGAGLLVSVGMDIHPISAVWLAPLLLMLLADSRLRIWRDRRAWALGAGFVAGALLFVAIHILPDPATYTAISALAFSDRTPPLLEPNTWSGVLEGVKDWLMSSLKLWCVPLLLALLWLLWRGPRRWPLVWLAHLAAIAAIVQGPRFYYAIIIAPLSALALAIWLNCLFPRGWIRPVWLAVPRGLALSLILSAAFFAQRPLLNNFNSDYDATLARERAAIPPDAVIMGNAGEWFGFTDHRFYAWESLVYYHHAHPQQTLADAMDALHPDIFIVDDWVDAFIVDEGLIQQSPEGDMALALPNQAFNRYLTTHGSLVTELNSIAFGRILIYRLAYPTVSRPQYKRY